MTTKLEQLRTWLTALQPEPVMIDIDTDLIESGLLTSLQFVQMVIEIERINQARLEPGVITIETMRTLRAIDQAVLNAQPTELAEADAEAV